MNQTCQWCNKVKHPLPSGVTICTTCDLTPISSIPTMRKQ